MTRSYVDLTKHTDLLTAYKLSWKVLTLVTYFNPFLHSKIYNLYQSLLKLTSLKLDIVIDTAYVGKRVKS